MIIKYVLLVMEKLITVLYLVKLGVCFVHLEINVSNVDQATILMVAKTVNLVIELAKFVHQKILVTIVKMDFIHLTENAYNVTILNVLLAKLLIPIA